MPEPLSDPADALDADLRGVLDFLRAAERMKDTLRSGRTSEGRAESVAEHTWRLCLMAMLLHDRFPDVDFGRLVRMCLVHDLGEALSGDVPAPEQAGRPSKTDDERRDLLALIEPLPDTLRAEIAALWEEYEAAETPTARAAKGLDKLETLLQHVQGRHAPDFDYRFNLGYGRRYTAGHPTFDALRAVLDAETERLAASPAPRRPDKTP